MTKEELFRNWFVSLLFKSWGAFPVKRGRDVRAGAQLAQLLATEKVMLFPEGTRNRDGILGKGNRGVGKLIHDTRPVVIPTALLGLNQWKFPGLGQKALVAFGEPIDFGELLENPDSKENQILITERVMAGIAELLDRHRGEYY